ncbi:hypothetical protein BH09MYX1_BH09MYX1_63110 [soil metagenome]
MRRFAFFVTVAALCSGAFLGSARTARADDPVDRVDPDAAGVAVIAEGEATDAATVTWPLAQATYAKATLRPKSLSEGAARALVGEIPAEDAPSDVKELAELRRAVRGDDAVTREILGNVGRRVHSKAILVLATRPNAPPQVRLFDVGKKTFDAARWEPESRDGVYAWDGTVASVERSLNPPPPAQIVVKTTPTLAIVPAAPAKDKTKWFYESPWFWIAVGGAALLGGGIFLGTRDWSGDNVHLRMQVPQ